MAGVPGLWPRALLLSLARSHTVKVRDRLVYQSVWPLTTAPPELSLSANTVAGVVVESVIGCCSLFRPLAFGIHRTYDSGGVS